MNKFVLKAIVVAVIYTQTRSHTHIPLLSVSILQYHRTSMTEIDRMHPTTTEKKEKHSRVCPMSML